MPSHRPFQRGFTLIEMLAVVTVLVVLMSVAAPGMGKLLTKQRGRSVATSLHQSLLRARSEALKQNATITVTPLAGSTWASGWRVASASATLDTTAAAPGGFTITATPSSTASVAFRYDGHTSNAAAVSFSVRDADGNILQCVSVDASGRTAVKEGSAAC